MLKISTHFKQSEVLCPCGCDFFIIDSALLVKLEIARILADTPFWISSWCRCPFHNAQVGGAVSSLHLAGEAVDIQYQTATECYKIVYGLILAGFKVVRIYKCHIHASYFDSDVPSSLSWGEY